MPSIELPGRTTGHAVYGGDDRARVVYSINVIRDYDTTYALTSFTEGMTIAAEKNSADAVLRRAKTPKFPRLATERRNKPLEFSA